MALCNAGSVVKARSSANKLKEANRGRLVDQPVRTCAKRHGPALQVPQGGAWLRRGAMKRHPSRAAVQQRSYCSHIYRTIARRYIGRWIAGASEGLLWAAFRVERDVVVYMDGSATAFACAGASEDTTDSVAAFEEASGSVDASEEVPGSIDAAEDEASVDGFVVETDGSASGDVAPAGAPGWPGTGSEVLAAAPGGAGPAPLASVLALDAASVGLVALSPSAGDVAALAAVA